MKVLQLLAEIWKTGAITELGKDGNIAMKNHILVPEELMKYAEIDFSLIENWHKSWVGATAQQITVWKAYKQFCNWGKDEKVLNWLNVDEHAALLVNEWLVKLHHNGWNDIYEDYRTYEDEQTNQIAKQIYDNAVAFATTNKSVEESV